MNIALILPIMIPLVTAALSLVAWRSRTAQRMAALGGAVALVAAAGLLLHSVWNDGDPVVRSVQLGDWPAPWGITLAADLFSALMVLLGAVMGLAGVVYSLGTIDEARESYGYYPLFHVLLMGVSGAFLTADVFNLYVWFEVLLMASFVLLALGGERPQIEGAVKYVTLNLIASALFLAGVGILYGVAGTLNMADLARTLDETGNPAVEITVSALFLAAFGIKSAMFPLFFWLPASYHTPPVAVSAIFSALLTKVGVYAMIRMFTLVFIPREAGDSLHPLILGLAGLTMITGVLGAVAQTEFRRLLAFHVISQIGYLLMGLGLYSRAALAAAVFFMLHVVLAKAALFLVSGVTHRRRGTYELRRLGGFFGTAPFLSVLFLVAALSLAGLPPLSGFVAKLAMVRAGLHQESYLIVAAALGVSILTLFSMIKIWNEVFWKPAPVPHAWGDLPSAVPRESAPGPASSASADDLAPQPSTLDPQPPPYDRLPERPESLLFLPIVFLAVLGLALGLLGAPIYSLAEAAAEQLFERRDYIDAILGARE